MADVAVADLSPRLQKLATQIRTASAQANHDYVIALSRQVLDESPGCIAVRKLYRQAQLQVRGPSRSLGRTLKGMMAQWKPASAGNALGRADAILAADPRNAAGLNLLALAAKKAGYAETELLAREALWAEKPGDLQVGAQLVALYLDRAQVGAALATAEQVVKVHPHQARAQALLRQASIAQTLRTGNWDADGTFRDKRRD